MWTDCGQSSERSDEIGNRPGEGIREQNREQISPQIVRTVTERFMYINRVKHLSY